MWPLYLSVFLSLASANVLETSKVVSDLEEASLESQVLAEELQRLLTRLEEELVTCRLAEVDTLTRLQECQARLREMEHTSKSSRLHLSRQDAFVIKLQVEIIIITPHFKQLRRMAFISYYIVRMRLSNKRGSSLSSKLS